MESGVWVSITEYQNLKNLSVSTIRRYIKADRVKWKLENKRYFIYITTEKYLALKSQEEVSEASKLEEKLEIERLKKRIKILEDEKNDLMMLVKLYEKVDNNNVNKDFGIVPQLPELPIG